MGNKLSEQGFLEHNRFFFSSSDKNYAQGWYAETREGVLGPFINRKFAKQYLDDWIKTHPSKRKVLK